MKPKSSSPETSHRKFGSSPRASFCASAISIGGEGSAYRNRTAAALIFRRLPEAASTCSDASLSVRTVPALSWPSSSKRTCMRVPVQGSSREPSSDSGILQRLRETRGHFARRHQPALQDDVEPRDKIAADVLDGDGQRAESRLHLLARESETRFADFAQHRTQFLGRHERVLGVRVEPGAGQIPVELVRREMREHHLADRRAIRGQAPAHVERRRHDARGRRAGDVHDLVTVEYCERARLVQLFAQPIQDRLRQHRERRRRQISMAERQHARSQVEPARVVGRDEAELRQRVQAASRRRARNTRPMADLRDRHPALLVRKGQHHGESSRQRRDKIGVVAKLRDGLGDELRRIRRPRRRRHMGELHEWLHRLKDIGFARHEGPFG